VFILSTLRVVSCVIVSTPTSLLCILYVYLCDVYTFTALSYVRMYRGKYSPGLQSCPAMHDIGARGPQPAAGPRPAAISAGCGPFLMPRTGTARPLLYLSRPRPAAARLFRSSECWVADDT
jgi:hypothetical protein